MAGGDDRPSANARQPDLTKPLEVTQALLEIEWERLLVAQRIEKERNIVFPETTVIIRDIEKLQARIIFLQAEAGSEPKKADKEKEASSAETEEGLVIPQLD